MGVSSQVERGALSSSSEAHHGEAVVELSLVDASSMNSSMCTDRDPTVLASSHSSFSENAESVETLKAFDASGHLEKRQNTGGEAVVAKYQEPNSPDCHGDDSSCISKADCAAVVNTDHIGNVDQKNTSSSSASVDSSFAECLDNAFSGQSPQNCSAGCQRVVVEEQKYTRKLTKCSSELSQAKGSWGCSDPSEIIASGDERNDTTSPKDQLLRSSLEQTGPITSSRIDVRTHEEDGFVDSVKPESVLAGSDQSATDALNSSDANRDLIPEAPLHPQASGHTDGLADLVDVRVCDICGDIGREYLLAVCSRCNDGAEHIYCMRIKADKVPEGEWMCEDCLALEDAKKQKQGEVEVSSRATEEQSELRKISSSVDNNGKVLEGSGTSASHFAGKRYRPKLEVRSVLKRRKIIENSVQPLGSYGSCKKNVDTGNSLLKSINEGKYPTFPAEASCYHPEKSRDSSSGLTPTKVGQTSHGGLLPRSKSVGIVGTDSKFKSVSEHAQGKRLIAEKAAMYNKNGEYRLRKLKKATSFNGVSSVPSNRLESKSGSEAKRPSFCEPRVEVPMSPRHGKGKIFIKRNDSVNSSHKTSNTQPRAAPIGCSYMKLKTGLTVADREEVSPQLPSRKKAADVKDVETCRSPKMSKPLGSLAYKDGKSNITAQSSPRNKPSSRSCDPISFSNKNAQSHDEVRASQPALKEEIKEAERHGVNSDKDRLASTMDLPKVAIAGTVSTGVSAVPDSECVWKGMFKSEEGGEIITDCDGIQAHLSTRASPRVREFVLKFPHDILFKKVPFCDIWPSQFQKSHVTEDDVALYFFAEDLLSYWGSYKKLLDRMTANDLALQADLDGVELLIFPSQLLPQRSQRWNTLSFLWGVFRVSKVNCLNHSGGQIPSLNSAMSNQDSYVSGAPGIQKRISSPPKAGTLYAAYTSHEQRPDSDKPKESQFSALSMSADRRCELEASSVQKGSNSPKTPVFQAEEDYAMSHSCDPLKNGWFSEGVQNNTVFQIQNAFHSGDLDINTGEDIRTSTHSTTGKPLNLAKTFRFSNEPEKHDSFSFDSGPSGSSEGGDPTEHHMGLYEDQSTRSTPNVELCLGTGGKQQTTVDLDLTLALASTGHHEGKHSSKETDSNNSSSLALSLALPCFYS